MKPVQESIRSYLSHQYTPGDTYREIGRKVGIKNPQSVIHHINKLIQQGYIPFDPIKNKQKEFASKVTKMYSIPLVGLAYCGHGDVFDQIEDTETIQIPSSFVQLNEHKHYLAVTAEGTSMQPRICPGDRVIVEQVPELYNQDLGLVIFDGQAMIKKIYQSTLDQWVLLSYNPVQPPIPARVKDIQVVGKVISIISTPRPEEAFSA